MITFRHRICTQFCVAYTWPTGHNFGFRLQPPDEGSSTRNLKYYVLLQCVCYICSEVFVSLYAHKLNNIIYRIYFTWFDHATYCLTTELIEGISMVRARLAALANTLNSGMRHSDMKRCSHTILLHCAGIHLCVPSRFCD